MLGAIGLIYDTTIDSSRWGAALDEICTTLGAKACALLVQSRTDVPYDVNALSRAYRDYVQTPEGAYYLSKLRIYEKTDWEAFARQPVGRPFTDLAVGITQQILDSRPDCVALEKHLGVRRRLGIRLNDTPVWFDGLTVGFCPNTVEVPLKFIAPIVPHLARAIELGRTFAHLQAQYHAVLTALDRINAGLAIALSDGQIIVANEETHRILSLQDGIFLGRNNRLRASSQSDTSLVLRSIASAAQTARGEGKQTESRLQLKRRDHNSPLLIDITPLRDSGRELDMYLEGALITLIDPDFPRLLEVGRFAELHSFSPAERDVCTLLIEGRSLVEIAELRGTTQTTVKNQVNRFLAKAGAASRFDLIRKIARTVPQFC